MSTITAAIRRHPLVSFFTIAFVVGWSPWPFGIEGTSLLPVAPLVAALIVAAVTGTLRDLGRRMIRWRVPWWCYLAAVGLPLAVIFSTVAIARGASWQFAWADIAMVFALRWVNPMDGPLGEEPGWRGFALPRRDALHSPLASAAVLASLVALWHLPLVFVTQGNHIGWIGLPITFVITFVYCWLFRRSDGSVLLTMLFHVVQGTITPETFGYEGSDIDRVLTYGLVAWTVIALATMVLDRGAWTRRPSTPEARRPDGVLTTPIVQP
ncbi:CPBP family intramembrane metalloprotease [Actinoplanes sp. LDG1-06]|uniref:CPBP family intramembrane metalloprotease n=1 Tax=Paractinoplanes ovalisporus TaxID=2810368 RepID=A0ABS2AF12_9ACTN|nr:type II CAAX endopeptidase family protein [Actinoplanes ovalisporus]MBM2618350.1 CPBP family intramembrane metalloprotease [Actinoplanes ovalisporus]